MRLSVHTRSYNHRSSQRECGGAPPEPWAPTSMGKGGATAPLWKCCKVFLCIGSYSKTLSRRTHYFHILSSASGGFAPKPPPGLHSRTTLGTFVPRPLICPPLKKILPAPMPRAIVYQANLLRLRALLHTLHVPVGLCTAFPNFFWRG